MAHADHKNLVCKTFNTECVMRWQLLIEEFDPKLRCIKGEQNVVADVLSHMHLMERDFSFDAFAFDDKDEVPASHPLTFKAIATPEQRKWKKLQTELKKEDSPHKQAREDEAPVTLTSARLPSKTTRQSFPQSCNKRLQNGVISISVIPVRLAQN